MIDFKICENVDDAFSHFTAAMFLTLSKAKFTILRRACNKVGGAVLPEDLIAKIKTTENLDDLFDVLGNSPYWNWMNIRMLRKMASASLQPDASKLIKQYQDEVYSRQLIEVLRQIPHFKIPDKYYATIKEKWDKNLDEITVQDLVTHWYDVERIFDVQEPTVLLDRIVDGCVEIYWLVPAQIVEHAILSLNNQIQMLSGFLYFDIRGLVIKPTTLVSSSTLPSTSGKYFTKSILLCNLSMVSSWLP